MFRKDQPEIPGEPAGGSIQAISGAAGNLLTICIAFLGYWAFGPTSGKVDWNATSKTVTLGFFIGFVFLALVPFIASKGAKELTFVGISRWFYVTGAVFVFFSLFLAVVSSMRS
jgi:hypothetical protein